MADAPEYLIFKAGRGWYRPDSAGYTSRKAEAGRYTESDAKAITHPNGIDGPRDGMFYKHQDEVEDDPDAIQRAALDAETARADRAEAELEALRRDHASLKDAQTDAINDAQTAVAGAYQAAADRIGQPDIDLEDVIGTQKAILALTSDDAREAEARVIQDAVAAALREAARRIEVECWTDFDEGQTDSIVLAEQETASLAIREVLDLIPTDALARLEARETAIQQQAYQKGYEDGARAEYESQALAAIRKEES